MIVATTVPFWLKEHAPFAKPEVVVAVLAHCELVERILGQP